MRILLHEAIAGGGLAGAPLPSSLLAEGRLMLLGLLSDFGGLPGVSVVTTHDARIDPSAWPAAETHAVEPGADLDALLDRLAESCDATLVVAPETGGVLESRLRRLARPGRLLLDAAPEAVALAADKGRTAEALAAAGLATPSGCTVRAEAAAIASALASIGYPSVLKPADGAGALGTVRVGTAGDAPAAAARVIAAAGEGAPVRVERWVEGKAASVALLVAAGDAVPLALNAQDVRVAPDGTVGYAGGSTPLDHPLRAAALDAARRAALAIPGLVGWAGVDLVLSPRDGVVAIEVNPRVTTPYAGLRLVAPLNLGGLVLEAVRDGRLPDGPLSLRAAARWTASSASVVKAAAA
jgi:predicted ATP-grasp superfamily ATP-dependent carboligase